MFPWPKQGRCQTLTTKSHPGSPVVTVTVPLSLARKASWAFLTLPSLGGNPGYQGRSSSPSCPPVGSPWRPDTMRRRRRWSRDSPLCGAAVATPSECTGRSWQLPKSLGQAGVTRRTVQAWPWQGIFHLQITEPQGCARRPGLAALGWCHPSAGAARQSEPRVPAQWPRLRLLGCRGARRLGKHSKRLC